jgi:putative oxidoreductase
MNDDKKFKISMLFLRSTVFLVMLMWTLDKFINPAHAAKVYEKFYFIPGLDNLMITVIGAAELVLLLLFFFGFKKKFTYGVVLALHAVSTLSSFGQYLTPFEGPNLLFFAAWPMLAACFMLFLFREKDSLLQLGPKFA